jgi:hypothetical protein
MSEKNKKGMPGNGTTKVEPGKTQTKKVAHHRKVIEDAANFAFDNSANNNQSTTTAAEDYELGKVGRSKKESYHDEVNMVKDLDKWG